MPADAVYSEEQVRARLQAELPHWKFEGGMIQRRYRTYGWKSTLMVVNAIGHLAEAAFHHPDLTVSYPAVTVNLMTHSENGITDKDFDLAKKIEEVVQWQPGPDAALEGVPDDSRFKYIKYDT